MSFDFPFMLQVFFVALGAVPLSLGIAFFALIVGMILGTIIALIRFYRVPFFSVLCKGIITIIQGIPVILLYLSFFLLFMSTPNIPSAAVASLALILPATARISEVIRGALQSISRSQFDAAYAIGHTEKALFFRIILPQLIPVSIPLIGNVSIQMIKAVPIATLIGVNDILNTALLEATVNYRYLESYIAAGLIFWGLFIIIENFFSRIEKHFNNQMRRREA
ncbi:MAG: ABC transporter permease subunit [Spirochaetaceae bacterium]|jgi:L-cystine transport system permease protein|nr:ABC transporter permease subunit [Spirochaetaceae bacterium]